MPRNDFWCPVCDQIAEYLLPAGARPICPHGPALGVLMVWLPPRLHVDAYEPFQEFQATDGAGRPVLIDNLRKLRAVEEDSLARARNGDGQPLIWRDFSQDRSNRDVHTLAKDLTRPMSLQDSPIRPDPRIFRPRRGDQVARDHGAD